MKFQAIYRDTLSMSLNAIHKVNIVFLKYVSQHIKTFRASMDVFPIQCSLVSWNVKLIFHISHK